MFPVKLHYENLAFGCHYIKSPESGLLNVPIAIYLLYNLHNIFYSGLIPHENLMGHVFPSTVLRRLIR